MQNGNSGCRSVSPTGGRLSPLAVKKGSFLFTQGEEIGGKKAIPRRRNQIDYAGLQKI